MYESPLDLNVFNELKDICDITIHIDIVGDENDKISLTNLNYVNTFISIGACETRPSDLDSKVKEVLGKYQILYKEIREEKVKDSLLFLMENSY